MREGEGERRREGERGEDCDASPADAKTVMSGNAKRKGNGRK